MEVCSVMEPIISPLSVPNPPFAVSHASTHEMNPSTCSLLSAKAKAFVPKTHITQHQVPTLSLVSPQPALSFLGCSTSDTERDNSWNISKAYGSDYEQQHCLLKGHLPIDDTFEWETDIESDEEESKGGWHAKKESVKKRNQARFEKLISHIQGGVINKPRRSKRHAQLRTQLIDERNLESFNLE
ncbi:unnamed protein product [Cuscuta campestris]|uniref:Uncharacterized protein n=1 Tax=Cuscuta campestris TaxID=132261 RepID=A0A484LLI3_9ASTE|nr:unnamed protein product [Cuscuta campestris]